MNEDQIERKVERATDYLDRQFLAGVYDQATYDRKMAEITAWADRQYIAARRQAQKHREEFRRRCREDSATIYTTAEAQEMADHSDEPTFNPRNRPDDWQTLLLATRNAMQNMGR